MMRYDTNPIIILINNDGYTIEARAPASGEPLLAPAAAADAMRSSQQRPLGRELQRAV